MSAGQQRAVNAEGYHPRPTTRAAFVVEPDGRRPKSIAERGWVRFGGTVTELGWAAIHSGQWKNPPALVMRQLRARQERSYVNLQRYCEERHAAEDKPQADRLLMPPPPPPPSSPLLWPVEAFIKERGHHPSAAPLDARIPRHDFRARVRDIERCYAMPPPSCPKQQAARILGGIAKKERLYYAAYYEARGYLVGMECAVAGNSID